MTFQFSYQDLIEQLRFRSNADLSAKIVHTVYSYVYGTGTELIHRAISAKNPGDFILIRLSKGAL
jgi:hypothetical protein